MRAGQLSNPAIVKLLTPFVVTSWHGANETDMSNDVRDLWERAQLTKRSNVFMFILDSEANLVHAFNSVRGVKRGTKDEALTPPEEIRKARAKLNMFAAANDPLRPVTLPDLPATNGQPPAGARLFVRRSGAGNQLVVELVPMTATEWSVLNYPETAREIEPAALRSFLKQMYPPAIRTVDQQKPFVRFTGSLRLEPAGADAHGRYALMRGNVVLAKGDEKESGFEGTLQAVVTYPHDSAQVRSLRGVVEGDYLYRIRGTQKIPLIAAIESRPDADSDILRNAN